MVGAKAVVVGSDVAGVADVVGLCGATVWDGAGGAGLAEGVLLPAMKLGLDLAVVGLLFGATGEDEVVANSEVVDEFTTACGKDEVDVLEVCVVAIEVDVGAIGVGRTMGLLFIFML
ncbi:MAG: hypothetical protein M0Z45_08815 [Actinomycetota bacterium]|nr:hypothetical protein [Actinomycetota bacterium]